MFLDAAVRVMAKRGYDGTSMIDALSEAGLSTRSFYRHFDSRYELRLALIHRERDQPGPTTLIFSAPSVLASHTLATSVAEMRRKFCPPLIKALQDGTRAGVLVSPRPKADTYSIHALIRPALDMAYERPLPRRSRVKSDVLRFAWPALGLAPDGSLVAPKNRPSG